MPTFEHQRQKARGKKRSLNSFITIGSMFNTRSRGDYLPAKPTRWKR